MIAAASSLDTQPAGTLFVRRSETNAQWNVWEATGDPWARCRSYDRATRQAAEELCRRWTQELDSGLVPGFEFHDQPAPRVVAPLDNTFSRVKSVLTTTPQRGEQIAKAAGVSFEDGYHALVWLYDRGQAFISRGGRNKPIEGWVG